MANLILPRSLSVAVDYQIYNYFMTAPLLGIVLPAATATDIGPTQETWEDDTGTTITEFAVDISNPPTGTTYAYQLIIEGQVQQEGLITDATNTLLELTSASAGTIPGLARVVFSIYQVDTTTSYS